MKTFKELGLSCEFISVLEKVKITIPSEIQEKAIPLVLIGKDIIGGSATGSGKTLVFASGIIENFKKNENIQALVLTPTRELAEQVANSIKIFSKYKKLNVLPIYGGINIENQIRKIRTTDIIVGTPGRILDHLNRRTLNLSKIKFLVLDEVDRMFDMGFQKDVEMILNECPKQRQTMLFSATISSDIDYLAQKHTKNPIEISVKSHIDASKLRQVYYDVPDCLKFSLFIQLLKEEKSKLVMVFCGTRRNVDFVTNNLNNLGIKSKAIHGGMIQNKRSKVMNEFNGKGGTNVLVCTDVAARGLDIKGVSHVYNYDLPKTSEEYIHRIGRTARAGKEGIAINILCSRDYENFSNIQRDEKLKITEVKAPYISRVKIIVEERKKFSRNGRANGGRFNSNRKPRGRNFSRGKSNSQRKSRDFNKSKSNSRRSNKRISSQRNTRKY
jgi:ATP-dependent RNA helicase DeaD